MSQNFLKPPKKKKRVSYLEETFAGELKLFGLSAPLRQYRFHPQRQWAFDFAWPGLKIAVELHGGLYMSGGKGGHNRGAYMEEVFVKLNEAQRLGWRVFCFGPKHCNIPQSANSSEALVYMYGILKPESGAAQKVADVAVEKF